ncbi:ADP-ribosylglycohydrolase family protein [Pelagibacterales bacterium SAG-MED37]|nr:ADP-ribosylglycohydrolase family protein [Pelagibacterales bacterium SAG-MED37]
MKNNLHVFLGASVADAAARPLHWVYNQKKLLTYIKGKQDFTFLKKNKSPFYNIKTGKVSGYNEVGQVMFKTLVEGHRNIEERFKKNITKNFGPGSIYWKNLNLRAKYKKVKDWRGIIKGPWIHQNIIETVRNIKSKKKLTGGKKVNESDGYCAALPYFLYGYNLKDVKKIISTVTVSKISLKYALAKFYLIDLALKGCKDPINEFMKIFKKNSYFKSVVEDMKKVKRLKSKPHSLVVKKLGMACSYPGTFNSSIHSIINSTNYKGAILKTIKAGGCNCSRVNFIGAYFAALKGLGTIPKSWIKKTDLAKKILEQK